MAGRFSFNDRDACDFGIRIVFDRNLQELCWQLNQPVEQFTNF
jgi:hypothetical protein